MLFSTTPSWAGSSKAARSRTRFTSPVVVAVGLAVVASLAGVTPAQATHPPDTELELAVEEEATPEQAAHPREDVAYARTFAIAVYGAGQGGVYGSGGIGGRLRWEVIDEWLGVEVFGESFLVDNHDDRLQHDHQVGFNIYLPFELGAGFRLRPLFGFCTTFSFIEPTERGGVRADDVRFGAHAGLGLEWAFASWASVFLDTQAHGYLGHHRDVGGWLTTIDDDLAVTALFQANVGIQLHFGGP